MESRRSLISWISCGEVLCDEIGLALDVDRDWSAKKINK